jgi:small subunit ribosomal protein S1
MRVWTEVEQSFREGRILRGRVIDRIKGGLTVDVGVRAFLPGSLADIKPVKNLESLKGRELEFKVISLDRRRNNIVLSRKAVLEKEYEQKKAETLEKLQEGVVMKGVVKNITDYGAFVDLGGIDGLLHITDISWGRVNHPSEHFDIGQEIEVVVLKFDRESERVSLGFKQRTDDPWVLVDKKFPIGARVKGKVVSLVDYGAFVELEPGVEGLVHVSEMSWTKKVVNPAKVLNPGQEIDAIVTELDLGQRRISLSLRQTERNPWEDLSHHFRSARSSRARSAT